MIIAKVIIAIGSLRRRVPQLLIGLVTCAVGIVMTIQADLGVSPWDVLHGGLSERLGISFGTVVQVTGLVVLALGMLLGGVRPGIGTFANIALIGATENVLLDTTWLDGLHDDALVLRVVALLLGVALIGFGAALYIGAHLGAGPRDSLMVAVHLRSGRSVGLARTAVEVVALALGLVLGGPAGVGTLVYTAGIGAAVQMWFRVLRLTPAHLPETTGEPI